MTKLTSKSRAKKSWVRIPVEEVIIFHFQIFVLLVFISFVPIFTLNAYLKVGNIAVLILRII